MKRYIKSSENVPSLEDAIKGYTAQGGQLSSKYPFTSSMRSLLFQQASSSVITLHKDIWRKIDLSRSQYESIFNQLYEYDEYEVEINNLESFTEDRHRAFSYGGTQQQYVIYHILSGAQVHGLEISQYSVYPEEEEVLLGKNHFIASYRELEWTSTDNMILTLR